MKKTKYKGRDPFDFQYNSLSCIFVLKTLLFWRNESYQKRRIVLNVGLIKRVI